MERISKAFGNLQVARHRADYDPEPWLTSRRDAASYVDLAQQTVEDIDRLSLDARRELAAILIVKSRKNP
jgi:hypothetical protein